MNGHPRVLCPVPPGECVDHAPTARPTVVCPRCGGADTRLVSTDGTRRCGCGQEFEVDVERPKIAAPLFERVAS